MTVDPREDAEDTEDVAAAREALDRIAAGEQPVPFEQVLAELDIAVNDPYEDYPPGPR